MPEFFVELKLRNAPLYYFGLANFGIAILLLVAASVFTIKVYQVNAFYKPIKFALSIGMYSWTMGWYCAYLKNFNLALFNWSVIILLGFEVLYIAIQASRGQLSHYNMSTSFYSALYSLMALAATGVTLYTAYIAFLFFSSNVSPLPVHYLWAIRIGLITFVIFSFEGFLMGSNLSHTIGGKDGSAGLPFLNWSYSFGDPRVAHFIGMHSLQIVPLLSYFLLKNTKLTILLGVLYFLYALFTLSQALKGKPFIKKNIAQQETLL